MQYIGIIGVPGTGKSELAEAVKEKFPEEDYLIVDEYVRPLEHDLEIKLGSFATYLPNLMVALEREKAERAARLTGRSTITCGTALDTLSYAGINVEYQMSREESEEQQMQQMKEMNAATVISTILMDTFRYNHVFYLPIPAQVHIPGQELKFKVFEQYLDRTIGQGIDKLGIPVVELTGTMESKLETIANTISVVGAASADG